MIYQNYVSTYKDVITTDEARLSLVEKLIKEGKITLKEGIALVTDKIPDYNWNHTVTYTQTSTDIGGPICGK